MRTTQSARRTSTREEFYLRFITKKDLVKDLDFESTLELEKAMKAIGKEKMLEKQGWYYSPKEMANILLALGKIKRLPVLRFKTIQPVM